MKKQVDQKKRRLELIGLIKTCEQYKLGIAKQLRRINYYLEHGYISKDEHKHKLGMLFDGGNPRVLLRRCDQRILGYRRELGSCNAEIRGVKKNSVFSLLAVFATVFLIVGLGLLFFKSGLTGLTVYGPGELLNGSLELNLSGAEFDVSESNVTALFNGQFVALPLDYFVMQDGIALVNMEAFNMSADGNGTLIVQVVYNGSLLGEAFADVFTSPSVLPGSEVEINMEEFDVEKLKEKVKAKPHSGSVEIVSLNRSGVLFGLDAEFRKAGKVKGSARLEGLEEASKLDIIQFDSLSNNLIGSGIITTDVIAVSSVKFVSAVITLGKGGNVTDVVKCVDWGYDSFVCGNWVPSGLSFVDNGDSITFSVDSFSAYAGAEITASAVPSVQNSKIRETDVVIGKDRQGFGTSYPSLRINKWHNEIEMSVFADYISALPSNLSDGLSWQFGSIADVEIYNTNTTTEVDVVLHSKPPVNTFSFNISSDNLSFFYQPPLDDEHGKRFCNATDCWDALGRIKRHRPENVVGSYAVYHSTMRDDYSALGGENYMAGKAFHIYRPKLTDANNDSVWADLNIADGVMTVTIPQSFLNTAAYPVVIDPTFGYDIAGGTPNYHASSDTVALKINQTSPAGTNTLNNITIYWMPPYAGGAGNERYGFYSDSGGAPSSLLASDSNVAVTEGIDAWYANPTNLNYALSASTQYWVAIADPKGSGIQTYYDSGGTGTDRYGSASYLPDPWSGSSSDYSSAKISAYVTYTAAGDSTAPTVILEAPDDNSTNTTANTIDFTYNVSETNTVVNCSLIIQSGPSITINVTDTAMVKDVAGQNLTSYLDNGDYNWTVNCTDNSNNIGTGGWRNISIIDTTAPTVSLEAPDDNSTNTTSNTVDFSYNVSEANTLVNCSLIIESGVDTSINVTDTAMVKGVAGQNLTSYLDNADYNWTVNCTDISNNIGTGGWRNISISIVVDTTPPDILFVDPTLANGTETSNGSVEINISVSESQLGSFVWNWNGTNYTFYNESLVLMMNFDNNTAVGENDTTPVDVSWYGNNGTFEDNASRSLGTDPGPNGPNETGRYNGGWLFDGDGDFIKLGDTAPLNFSSTDEFTIAFWAYPRECSTSDRTVFGKFGWVDTAFNGYHVRAFSSAWAFQIGNGTLWYGAGQDSDVTCDENVWQHIVAVYNASAMMFYKNGTLINTTIINQTLLLNMQSSYAPVIGAYSDQIEGSFNGTIDELLVFNTSLSGDQVQQLYYSNLRKYDSNQWEFYTNQSNQTLDLASGSYTYFGAAQDILGNENMTEERTVTIGGDTTPPTIFFVDPTDPDDFTTGSDSSYVNVTISDASSNVSGFIDWNYSLVGYWPMDLYNSTAVFDNSSYGNDMVFLGGLGTDNITSGMYGKGLSFDSVDDYVNVDNRPSLQFSNFSVEAWVFIPTSIPSGWKTIMEHARSSTNWYGLWKSNNGNFFHFRWADNTYGVGNSSEDFQTVIVPDTWYHVVGVFDGSSSPNSVRMYINGNLDHELTGVLGVPSPAAGNLTIGSNNDPGEHFSGIIDEVRIWNRVLSEQEINASYNAEIFRLESNFTNLTAGVYEYTAYAIDEAGNSNQTEMRTLTVGLDTTPPVISFVDPTPADGTLTTNTSVEINVSVTEAQLGNFTWNWNGTNYSFFDSDLVLMFNLENASLLGENDTFFVDVSNYSNNGSCSGSGCPVYTSSVFGSGLVFDGLDDVVDCGNDSSLDVSNISVEAWVYSRTDNGGRLVTKQVPSTDPSWMLARDSSTDSFEWRFANGTGGVDWNGGSTSTNSFLVGSWYHVVATYDHFNMRVYVNGVENTGGNFPLAMTEDIFKSSVSVMIGYNTNSIYFNGTIDEVRVYNRSLTAAEVEQHYYSNLRKYDVNQWEFYTNQSNLTGLGLDNGTYTYFGAAQDTMSNENMTEERTITIGIDTTAPTVNLELPGDNVANDTSNTVDFTYNVSEATTLVNCSLIIESGVDTSINVTDTAMVKGVAGQNLTSYLDNADYNWTVNCTDISNNIGTGGWRNISIIVVNPPNDVTLYEPDDGNSTLFNITPTFTWYNTTDPDDSVLTYHLQVDETSSEFQSPVVDVTGIAEGSNLTSYVISSELSLDTNYSWRVRAYDGTDYGNWSANWTFIVASTVILSVLDSPVDFGAMAVGESNQTLSNSPYPLRVRNEGNVVTDVNVSTDQYLWNSYQSSSQYFQYQTSNATADAGKGYSDESGSFNESDSSTGSWYDIPLINTTASIRQLNFSDVSDEAEVDLRIEVPADESPGDKGASVVLTGWVSL